MNRFVVVCGDGEYIIYTAMVLRNKAFGTAQEFVWAQDSSEYAIREGTSTVKVFKNFKEKKSFKPDFGAEGNNRIQWHLHIIRLDNTNSSIRLIFQKIEYLSLGVTHLQQWSCIKHYYKGFIGFTTYVFKIVIQYI